MMRTIENLQLQFEVRPLPKIVGCTLFRPVPPIESPSHSPPCRSHARHSAPPSAAAVGPGSAPARYAPLRGTRPPRRGVPM